MSDPQVWFGPGTPEHDRASFVLDGLEEISSHIGHDSRTLCAGIISFLSPGWAKMSDADFETDLAELMKGFRLQRANIQSLGAVKS